jgi:CDP-diacylglycerol--glycerol-3-phosphate 3-phosphatidyltransferase
MPTGQWRLRTPANAVTAVRVAGTPVLIYFMVRAVPSWIALALWIVLTASDSLDGWLARRQGTTASGAFLDPLADKVLVLGALLTLAAMGTFSWAAVVLLAVRELVITVYRSWVGRRGISVPARPLGKAKTIVEFIAIGLVLLPGLGHTGIDAGRVALWVAVVLAYASATLYLLDSRVSAVAASPPR